MLEKVKIVTSKYGFSHVEYARFADDLEVLVDGYRLWDWLVEKLQRRPLDGFAKVMSQSTQRRHDWLTC